MRNKIENRHVANFMYHTKPKRTQKKADAESLSEIEHIWPISAVCILNYSEAKRGPSVILPNRLSLANQLQRINSGSHPVLQVG